MKNLHHLINRCWIPPTIIDKNELIFEPFGRGYWLILPDLDWYFPKEC